MSKLNGLVDQYASALQEYLNGGGEEALRHGYEFGRKALTEGFGGLELTKIHREALLRILKETPPSDSSVETIQRAYDFLAESMSSFEMTHRGFLDALSTLRISEERYRTLVESARDVIYTLSREGTITSLNPAFERITGWEVNDWLGKSFVPLVHPEDLSRALQSFRQVLQGESPRTFELRILTKSGGYIVTEFTKTPRKREEEIIGALGIARDVTERKKNEERIRRSEEIFRLITENAGDLIAVVDLQGRREYNSPSYGHLLGEPASLRGTDSFNDIHPDDREKIRRIFQDTIKTGSGQRAEYRLMTKDGTTRYIESQGSVIRDDRGQVTNILVVARDVTERKQADELLRQSEQRLVRAEQIAHVGNWEWDVASNKVTWSEELYRIYGLSPDGFGGTFEEFLQCIHPDDREFVRRSIETAHREKRSFDFEERIVLPNGSIRTLESRGEVMLDDRGSVVKMFGSCMDITDWKKTNLALNALTKRVMDAQEEERQRLARELHDDVCQRLTGIKFVVDDILTDIPPRNGKGRQRVRRTKKQIDQLISEVRRMSSNLRPAALDDFGVAVALRRMCEEAQKLWKKKITFSISGAIREHYDTRVEIALYRIVQEALLNTMKHANATKVNVTLSDWETTVHLEVRDNGKGIVKRPSSTRPAAGQHLGLVSMKERTELLGGTFALDSIPKKGTTITVEIPLPTQKP